MFILGNILNFFISDWGKFCRASRQLSPLTCSSLFTILGCNTVSYRSPLFPSLNWTLPANTFEHLTLLCIFSSKIHLFVDIFLFSLNHILLFISFLLLQESIPLQRTQFVFQVRLGWERYFLWANFYLCFPWVACT